MALRKPVMSLFDLSLTASKDHVMSTIKQIEVSHRHSNKYLSFDVPECSDRVQKLQDFLRDLLPSPIQELLFSDILLAQRRHFDYQDDEDIRVCDQRILYATFIYQDVNLKKLTFVRSNIYNSDSELLKEADGILKNQKLIDFWLTRIPMLTKLVEVDFDELKNDDIIISFSKTCTHLEIIRLSSYKLSPATIEAVLRNCTNLRELHTAFHEDNIQDILTPLGTELKLKLRNLHLMQVTAEQANLALDLCPVLQDLEVLASPDHYHAIVHNLASRPLTLSTLRLLYYANQSEVFNNLFTCKGIYITCLRIFSKDFNSPLEELRVISETCKNLTELELKSDWMPEENDLIQNVGHHDISFPKLEVLKISYGSPVIDCSIGTVVLLAICTKDSVNLTTLELLVCSPNDEMGDIVCTMLVTMFTLSSRLKQLTKLRMRNVGGCFSELLARTVYEQCTNLTDVSMATLSQEAGTYVETVRNHVKINNLNLTLN